MKKLIFIVFCIIAIIISCCFNNPRTIYYETQCPILNIDTVQQWDPVQQVHVNKYKVDILLNNSSKKSVIMSKCPDQDSLTIYL